MRKIKGIKAGIAISFDYKKGDVIEHRSGVIEKVFRSAGKSSKKENKGKKLAMFNVIEPGATHPKSFQYSKMFNIDVR